MKKEFEISIFGEIRIFVRRQVCQMKFGIFITQSKYIKEILKKFGMEDSKPIGMHMSTRLSFPKIMIPKR